MTDPELEPGVATEIYQLGYTAGQRSVSGDAKVLRDEWWKGYGAGMVDAHEHDPNSVPAVRNWRPCRPRGASPRVYPQTGGASHGRRR
jgi:hypothetical protein